MRLWFRRPPRPERRDGARSRRRAPYAAGSMFSSVFNPAADITGASALGTNVSCW